MKIIKFGIIVIMTFSIALAFSCSDTIDENSSKETTYTSAKDLRQQTLSLMGIDPNDFNPDSVSLETLPYDQLFDYMDLYYETFADLAYIGIGLNEDESKVDFYLIPFESQLAIKELNPIFAHIINAKFVSYPGNPSDKNAFYSWVDAQIKSGRIVATFYDKKKGTYGAMSFSKFEWGMMLGR